MQSNKAVKRIIVILSILLIITLIGLVMVRAELKKLQEERTATVPNNRISAVSAMRFSQIGTISAQNISVPSLKISEDTAPFHVGNMLPGDSNTNEYKIRVTYRDSTTIHFHPNITEDTANLADVMQLILIVDGIELYRGLLSEVPDSIEYSLNANGRRTETVNYKAIVTMDTGAGNSYKNQMLKADFCWWIEGNEDGGTVIVVSPETGAALSANTVVYFALAVIIIGGGMGLLFLMKQRRRKGNEE